MANLIKSYLKDHCSLVTSGSIVLEASSLGEN